MTKMETRWSACPHDCPSVCALDVEVLDGVRIGRVRGAKAHPYTAGVVCEKVARYAERIHHPERLLHPLRRKGAKGGGAWERISWEAALDETAEALLKAEARHGPEAVWPYYYAGTMGHVQRDGINRLRHAKRYSRQHSTICTGLSWAGYIAGTGALHGIDSRELAASDLSVIWGTNPVHTQVNVMTHVARARKERGARVAVIDVYDTPTMKQADIRLLIRPGTDGALACAVMHVLFRDGLADWPYLEKYTDAPRELAAHLQSRTPEWAAALTGLAPAEIEAFARAIGETDRTFFRIGYGFSRSRNGASNMHAVMSIPAVRGSWQYEGGGALHSSSGIYRLNKTMIEGLDALDSTTRQLDQSRIGPVLCGNPRDLIGGPPVTALVIQNTNPMNVAPDQEQVRRGFARKDLFVCVHEQFMTETAEWADIVMPASMFLEHDDLYTAGGHTHLMLGPKVMDAPGECRPNHFVHQELAKRLGAEHPGFQMSARELIDWTLKASNRGDLASMEDGRWLDCALPFERAHFLDGFGHKDGRFHFRADWQGVRSGQGVNAPELTERAVDGVLCGAPVPASADMPVLPDHWAVTEAADAAHPFRLVTAPARGFLNSSFSETPTSQSRSGGRPELLIHPQDAAPLDIADGTAILVGNERGTVTLHARLSDVARRGVVIAESLWPGRAHIGGRGINTLTGADHGAPLGGAAFHDNHVWVRPA
jgi:anaerobic selenocysteine-containing dehydrogenase